jgi:hypothetical protein
MVENLIRLGVSLGATEYRQLSLQTSIKNAARGARAASAYPWLILGLSLASA